MKSIILFFVVAALALTSNAQNIVINNNTPGDVYVTVFAVSTSSCTAVVDQTVTTLVSGTSTVSLNTLLGTTWASSTAPTAGTYDLSYAVVTRDASCPGSFGWGSFVGMINGAPSYYEEVTIGDPLCSFSPSSYIIVTYSGGGPCGNFWAGDTFHCDMSYPGGATLAQIDVLW